MPLELMNGRIVRHSIAKIGVVGPGIVGMPMAALLARAGVTEGTDQPARVVVVQRASVNSGWKVAAINEGRSPIGGVEPDLDRYVSESVAAGRLSATHDYAALADADLILVAVQTDKRGTGPDYGPLMEALDDLAVALRGRPPGNVPIVVFESTLAPSSMQTVIRERFARHGLLEGRDVLLANSPNRVMPGRLVHRVAAADKIVAGLNPETTDVVARVYSRIVTTGTLYRTNSLTAEVVKTLENAYRDVRIAYATEVARWCDARDIDFFALRDEVNALAALCDSASADPRAVPSGGLLVPMLGVGGHCLPKDGILLWWRAREAEVDTGASLILEARRINDDAPGYAVGIAERAFGPLAGRHVALLGTAYRFDSEDTRNSPTLEAARLLQQRGAIVRLHDPHVHATDANLRGAGLAGVFSRDLREAMTQAEVAFFCVAHREYGSRWRDLRAMAPSLSGILDACNLLHREMVTATGVGYAAIGRGRLPAPPDLVRDVARGFAAVERGVANEVRGLVDFLNARYADSDFSRIDLDVVRQLAGTCATGCRIADPGRVDRWTDRIGSQLVARAQVDVRD